MVSTKLLAICRQMSEWIGIIFLTLCFVVLLFEHFHVRDEPSRYRNIAVITVVLISDIDPIHKWWLFYFCSVIVQISLPSLTLEQELFSI